VTVILLIVGHRPVFQTGSGGDLLCLPQTALRLRTNRDLRLFRVSRPGHLSGFTQYDDRVYSAVPCDWFTPQLHTGISP